MEESGKLPANMALATDDQKDFNKKVQQIKKKSKDDGGVIYIGHIPHGFFEQQMKDYFSQFGTVKRLRISRSKKTGGHKGYAFVEFASEAVARIVADTMNNYLMFHRLLKCQFVPYTKLHPETFKGAGRRFKKPKAHLIARDRHNSVKSNRQMKEAERKMLKRKAKTSSKLAEMGIDYDFTISRNTTLGDPIEVEYIEENSSDSDDEETKSPSNKKKKTTPQKEQSNDEETKSPSNKKKKTTPQKEQSNDEETKSPSNKKKKTTPQKEQSNEEVKSSSNRKKTEKVQIDNDAHSEEVTSPSLKRQKVTDVKTTPKNKKVTSPKTSVKKTPQTPKTSPANKSVKQSSSSKKKVKANKNKKS